MKYQNNIGLDVQKSKELVHALNDLLANYAIIYQNIRGYHWNIQGDKFFELHLKFEELYNDFFIKIDEIAERILTLGHAPEHKYSNYLRSAKITESNEVSNGIKAIHEILDGFAILLNKERHILQLSGEIDDEGTNAQMSDYIREQEKLVWMYSAYISQG
ncbi:MAG: DNA starvation/stationary phase protection protein [Flavobacteriaceae bacterium]|jgi:starvation-inducible DNA-binding protein|nr:DNA starvation/stationary phase protection protein [Flavobacteriaceae bacterium]MDG2290980.1 DNA starvation/stationary phase protection protein [Flavobacteriaceae bacterium]